MIDADQIVYTKTTLPDGGAILRAFISITAQRVVQAEVMRHVDDAEIRARLRRDLYFTANDREIQLAGALRGVVHDLIAAALDGARSEQALTRARGYQQIANECLDALDAALRPPAGKPAGADFYIVQAPAKPDSAWHRSLNHPARKRRPAED